MGVKKNGQMVINLGNTCYFSLIYCLFLLILQKCCKIIAKLWTMGTYIMVHTYLLYKLYIYNIGARPI